MPLSASTSILFVGNSFTYGEPAGGSGPSVEAYQPNTVTDLNGTGVGGVPALFKQFTVEAGLDYKVSLETVGAYDLADHYNNKLGLIARPWDAVVLQSYSTLDRNNPGNPASLIKYTGLLAGALHDQNANVAITLDSTWTRADLTYQNQNSPWYGKAVDAMEKDIQAGYQQAAANSPYVKNIARVGDAWNRAFQSGFADPNPYDGQTANAVNLWAPDGYHASGFGYYLEALTEFGTVTKIDPRSLGEDEAAAKYLGFTPAQTRMLQSIAYATLQNTGDVPEPASWMTMIAGFGLVGTALRRRGRAPALAPA